MWLKSRPSASMAKNRWEMAPWRGSLPSSSRHLVSPLGSSSFGVIILTVSKGVALDTAKLSGR